MPQCSAGDRCICKDAPLEGRHFCAICKKDLQGPCGEFNGVDSAITYRNHCFSCSSTSMRNSQSTTTSDVAAASATRQSTLVSAEDMDPKAVTWNDVTVGDRPSNKPGEVGQIVKAALTICGLDAILFSTEQLRTICGVFKLTGY